MRIGFGKNPTRRVTVEDLECFDCNRGIGIFAREAAVEDVAIRNVRLQTRLFHGNWWGRAEPIHVSAVRYQSGQELPAVRRVTVENVSAVAENGICVFAEDSGAIEDVTLRNVTIELRVSSLFERWGGNLDLRPAADHFRRHFRRWHPLRSGRATSVASRSISSGPFSRPPPFHSSRMERTSKAVAPL